MKKRELCKRTVCLWRPGEPQPGMTCTFAYVGRVPGTGPLVCMTCGGRDEARRLCEEYAATHEPGVLSRKAEFEEE